MAPVGMRACVTGATGFVGAHLARLLAERGDDVRVTYRNPETLDALKGVKFRRAKADVLDYKAMRRACRGCDVLFHTAGYVGSSPLERVWRLNAHSPLVAVEAAAAEGLTRVVVTSTISAIGPANGRPADENTEYPENWTGLAYPDSKHEGEREALEAGERHGIEVVVVNPAYVLGVPVNPDQKGENSTRTVGNYLRGRLPAVIDAPMNFVDVEDVAQGHVLAAEKGKPGERYILGGENLTWPGLVDRMAELSGIHLPVLVLPREVAWVARIREAIGLPGLVSTEGYELMGQNWQFSSRKAERELGYRSQPIEDTLEATIGWYMELIEAGVFEDADGSGMSRMAGGMRAAGRLGLLSPFRLGQRVAGRRVLAGI
jgi:dihydroflavonol-4-reductase